MEVKLVKQGWATCFTVGIAGIIMSKRRTGKAVDKIPASDDNVHSCHEDQTYKPLQLETIITRLMLLHLKTRH